MTSDAAEGNIAERVRILEYHSRRNNIIVEGLPEKENENKEILQASVRELLNKKLDVNPPTDDMHRLGKKAGKKLRPVLIKLKSHVDKPDCIRAAPRLKGTNIYINDDVSRATQQIRKSKMPELKQNRQQGMLAYFSCADIVDIYLFVSLQRNSTVADLQQSGH